MSKVVQIRNLQQHVARKLVLNADVGHLDLRRPCAVLTYKGSPATVLDCRTNRWIDVEPGYGKAIVPVECSRNALVLRGKRELRIKTIVLLHLGPLVLAHWRIEQAITA